ncbi:MAG: phytoene/squalene synthase family protein [Chitinophagales bacterium]|jgi:phytoene synthase|nr:phytoene/squalene synthase family protein [Chitinophagales bacterium]
MKSLFDEVSVECSKLTTKRYSTSFSLGIYFLSKRMRNHIYAIYGFLRFADEIVDSFEGYNQARLFSQFKAATYDALNDKISLNPILNAFQNTVHQYNIDHSLIDIFFHSMEMDLQKMDYSKEKYEQYILGSAEVVGLMCLQVFTEGDKIKYQILQPFAMKLGAAFQKINFLRDLQADYEGLGRTYFPNVDMTRFNAQTKKQIEVEIELDFKEALTGIKLLPASSKGGVYLAYVYYYALFNKIKRIPAERVLLERIRINNLRKFTLMLNSLFQYKLKLV